MCRPVCVVLVALATTLGASAQQPANGPRPLYSTAAAFDPVRGRLVVFGGYGNGGYSGDTWEWDGARWSQSSATGPEPRNSPVMVFDSRRNRMVLFGGDTRDRIFGDTWAYDGKVWTKLSDQGPAPRSTHMLAYDAARDRVVLFGGFSQREGRQPTGYLTDTWEFDGTTWARVADAGPAGRTLAAFAYDPALRKVVMFGGAGANPNQGPPPPSATFGDSWEWDGARWLEAASEAPPPRDHVSMAYDVIGQRLVMTGGHRPGGGQLDDTWQRVGQRWSRVPATGTPALAAHRVIYDDKARRILTFGGFAPAEGPTANIWTLTGEAWALWRPSV
jgi:hypothetical protein